ncbi:cyclophilin-like peptidyl-prolyl cis-trans isomerase family protein [Klebsormidium nitens]|uniref:Peptidyl-prolyl cis-trans isomerase n=1 Tax=Klebsormidium nitens TaxID=105231 RepID=A0A0U9HR99_KLENI|nr:cyclophilin-like peptidyl-prolyl cis-trans isomerase family protein [Klebsormidium nitens]|eukprot:GAQ77981.1 cyclophilin-like peptidyl-prolyl cis-trans isomerase family protein [Klebsormidium nitens]
MEGKSNGAGALRFLILFLFLTSSVTAEDPRTELGDERVVLQTSMGDIEVAFFPKLAPITAAHILKLFKLGCYNSNHFFRVDKGFVAQIADVVGGRQVQLDARQLEEGDKAIPGETTDVPHVRGILSMARHDDPNSGKSSFSILLGNAPHLDGNYAIFGRVIRGDEVLARMELVETTTEGIFVMPKERITILSTYVYSVNGEGDEVSSEGRLRKLEDLASETVSFLERFVSRGGS